MRNKGKNAVILGMLVVCLFVASIVFISVYIKPEGNKFAELIYNTFGGSPKDIKEAHFTGEIIYDDYDVTKLISYEVPEGFVKADPNKEYYKISTNGTGTFNECSFKFGVVKDFKSGNSYVIKMAEYYEEGDKVSNPKGVEWTTYSTQDGTSTIYYRGATAKEKAILFEYRIGNDADQETCIAHYLKLMESITILKEE